MKILVVDSDRITTELLEAVLRDEGKEKNLRYFSKPSLIKDIKNGVIGILNR